MENETSNALPSAPTDQQTMVCPTCQGTGRVVASHVRYANGRSGFNVPLACFNCQGLGVVPAIEAAWAVQGRRLREWRIAQGRGLREEAERRGLRPSDLSKMECGKLEPVFPKEMATA